MVTYSFYSWYVAQRRVRDCFGGIFKEDEPLLQNKRTCTFRGENETYNIAEIHEAFTRCNKCKIIDKFAELKDLSATGEWKERIETNRADINKEYAEAVTANMDIKHGLREYSQDEVLMRVNSCYYSSFSAGSDVLCVEGDESGKPKVTKSYNIFDIYKAVCHLDEKLLVEEYLGEGPGSEELKKAIIANRNDLEKEFQEDKIREYKYTRSEAERCVKDCFVVTFPEKDTDIFPTSGGGHVVQKINHTYDIFDIQNAIEYFDSKKLLEKYPEEEGPESDKWRKSVDEQRAEIEREYVEATTNVEIEYGSGFVIQDHFLITNKHVINTALCDESKRTQISISNAVIGDLLCEVAFCDAGKDLALLYCPDLNLDGVCPLQLSNQPLLPGMHILSFGYPISHTRETALFVSGYVAGSKRTFSGHTMAVLNCPLNSGNSGGPVLCWVKGQLKVVGVATQKHFQRDSFFG